jgi:transcriptional regulator with XRE-family HTH domain
MKTKKVTADMEQPLADLLNKLTPELQEQTDYKMNLAAKIYQAMKARGWNQTIFAEEMGKKASVISRWLSGTHNFEADTLFEIQKKLHIRLLDVHSPNPLFFSTTIKAGPGTIEKNADWQTVVPCKIVPLAKDKSNKNNAKAI